MRNRGVKQSTSTDVPVEEQMRERGFEEYLEREALGRRMSQIKHKILVLSGKGGVGKSTVAANLAISLALDGQRVGLLDVDIHGPSIPKLLNIEGRPLSVLGKTIVPIEFSENLKVMSIGLLLRSDEDAVIWRGPMKMGVIKQFLKDVEWGELDYLIIDSPPGTGDEPLSVCQLVEDADGAIIVTTPQEVAIADVKKAITFCRKLNYRVLGIVENMSGFVCPKCSEITHIFKTGGGERLASEMGVPFLGSIPIDPQIVEASDSGKPYLYFYSKTETAKAFARAIRPVLEMTKPARNDEPDKLDRKENEKMRIAIPLARGKLSSHFGHCEEFAMIDVDPETKEIASGDRLPAPDHQPGLLPRWLHEHGADVIIAGGMGMRARTAFAKNNIRVVIGAPEEEPEAIAKAFLEGTLQTGANICDH